MRRSRHVAEHEQREDVELLDGMVLDGRNICNACYLLGREPRTRKLSDNTDPVAHLISKNLIRRHLTTLERALFAARLVKADHGGDRESSNRQSGDLIDTVTPADAARRIGVSERNVERARYILNNGADDSSPPSTRACRG